jgi:hypothetical protein
MVGCPEFKYWLKDNDKLELKDDMLPAWIATLNALEALITDIDENYPNIDKKEEDEDIDPQY